MSKRGVEKGYKQTKEHIENRAKIHRGLKRSEETKQRMRKPHRKFKFSKEYIEKFRKGKNNPFYGKHHTKETIEKIKLANSGENHPQWKGGRIKTGEGYIMIWQPTHPFCNHMGYVLEHRLVMEKYIGRYLLSAEIVHHINGIVDDNRKANLQLFKNHNEHKKFHWFQRVPIISN